MSCSPIRLVRTGLENLIRSPLAFSKTHRLGLLCNPASLDSAFNHAVELISRTYPGRLTALFSPQHGFYAEKQDNMIESGHMVHPVLEIPVYSLYSETRKPTREMFDQIDTLLIDLPDVGTRVYTFIYTISYCLELARLMNKRVVILDRPNPLNGISTEGNVLEPEFSSFVGRFPIPMRHGLTVGELSILFNTCFGIGCDLTVVPVSGWRRKDHFTRTGLAWTAPSPNLPTPSSSYVYPGQVIFEGTNLSEGRGTAMPFEQFGAPFISLESIRERIPEKIPGIVLRDICFMPTSGKFANETCNGFFIHIVDFDRFKPYKTSLMILQAVMQCCKYEFKYKSPPYEYEYEKLPIDLILGSSHVRNQLEQGCDPEDLEKSWATDLEMFNRQAHKVFLYES